MDRQQWSKIIELYQDLKYVTLLAEEFEWDDFKDFLQPVLEQRSALDHICRAMSVEVGMQNESDAGDYTSGNFEKAIGHLYRAFYDAADMLSMILREKIIDVVEGHDIECITAVCPEYYKELRPRLEQISTEIAGARNSKDIKVEAAIDHVKSYGNLLDELRILYIGILPKVPSLHEYTSKQKQALQKQDAKQKRARVLRRWWEVALAVVSATVAVIATYLLMGRQGK